MNSARTSVVRALCAVAMGTLCLAAVGGDEGPGSRCPNYGVKHKAAYQLRGNPLGCSLPEVDVGGVKVKATDAACFSYITEYPERDISTPKSGFYVKPAGLVVPTRTYYECEMDYWLFIPLGRLCVIKQTKQLRPLQSYVEVPCGTGLGGE